MHDWKTMKMVLKFSQFELKCILTFMSQRRIERKESCQIAEWNGGRAFGLASGCVWVFNRKKRDNFNAFGVCHV